MYVMENTNEVPWYMCEVAYMHKIEDAAVF